MHLDYAARRQTLLNHLPAGSIALIPSGAEQIRNRDVEFPFRAESDFLYLTGFTEPDSLLVLIHQSVFGAVESAIQSNGQHQAWLFVRPKDPLQETWQGRRLGVDAAPKTLGIDQAWSIDDLDQIAPTFLAHAHQLYVSFAQLKEWSVRLADWLNALKAQVRKGVAVPTSLCDLDSVLHEQRLVKSAEEIALMRQAAQISVQGHLAAMRVTRPGAHEYQVQSALEHAFKMAGSERVAFNSIAAAGDNACILHYTENNACLQDGDLILLDAGAEWCGYAGDISHTYPINGRFSPAQKQLYELVLRAQHAAVAAVQPGQAYDAMHLAASRAITAGLVQLGILQGDVETLLKDETYKQFFMHGTGHWLGLDVHDVGRYKVDGQWRRLQPGMVVTIEPGIYIPLGAENVDAKWHGVGIRIEDDVLVTEQGHEVLTIGLPRTVEQIEQWMQAR